MGQETKHNNRKSGGYNVAWLIPTQAVAFNILAPIYFLTNELIFFMAVAAYVLGLALVVLPREQRAASSRRVQIYSQLAGLAAEINRRDPEIRNIKLHDEYHNRARLLERELESLPTENSEMINQLTEAKSRVVELTSNLKQKKMALQATIFSEQL